MPETIAKGCSCAETLAHLHAFVDRECDEQLTARLQTHVAGCSHCKAQADAVRHLQGLLRSRCAEQAPQSLVERVRTQLAVVSSTCACTPSLRECGHGGAERRTTTVTTSTRVVSDSAVASVSRSVTYRS